MGNLYAGLYSLQELAALWEGQAPAGTPAAAPGVAQAMALIAKAESAGGALGGPNTNGTYDYGIWQVNSSHGFDPKRLLTDAQYNAQAAVQVFNGQAQSTGNGFGAWSTYNGSPSLQSDVAALLGSGGAPSGTGAGVGITGAPSITTDWSHGAKIVVISIAVVSLSWILWGQLH